MTRAEVGALLRRIAFTDVSGRMWQFHATQRGDCVLVYATFDAPDCDTGHLEEQTTRKWFVSEYATQSEVIFTCLGCVKMALIHEAHESFYVDGYRVVEPHVDALALAMADLPHDARQHLDA